MSNADASHDQDHQQQNQSRTAEQAGFFCYSREDEVRNCHWDKEGAAQTWTGAHQAAGGNRNLRLHQLIGGAGSLCPGAKPDIDPGFDDVKHKVASHPRDDAHNRQQQQKTLLLRGYRQHENIEADEQAGGAEVALKYQQKARHPRYNQCGQNRSQQGNVGFDLVREKSCQVDDDQQFQRLRRLKVKPKRLKPQLRARTSWIYPNKECQTNQQQSDQQPDVFIAFKQPDEPVYVEPYPKQGATHHEPTELFYAEVGRKAPDCQQPPSNQRCKSWENPRIPNGQFVDYGAV